MASLWRAYLGLLARRPLPTKCITSGLIMAAGDAIQQTIEMRAEAAEQRAAAAAASAAAAAYVEAAASSAAVSAPSAAVECTPDGCCALPPRRPQPVAAAPLAPVAPPSFDVARCTRSGVFGALAVGPVFHVWFRTLDRLFPGSGSRQVLSKLAWDQLAMAPVFTSFYFAGMGAMEGASLSEIQSRWSHGFGPTLAANYMIFPLAQGINFAFVPLHLQVLVLNAGGLAYNVVLSKYNAQGAKHKRTQEHQQQQPQQQPLDKLPIATAAETAAQRRKLATTAAATA